MERKWKGRNVNNHLSFKLFHSLVPAPVKSLGFGLLVGQNSQDNGSFIDKMFNGSIVEITIRA